MPPGPVENKQGVGSGRHLGRYFIEMPLHGLCVAPRQDEGRADPALGTDGAKDIGRFGALVLGCRGSAAAWRPAPGELGLLTDPGLILPPDFYPGVGWKAGTDRLQLAREVFLKSSTANSF